ncbi:hypothetical protein A3L04_04720 [Thermococcus chitonophagus]|uniref:Uncharacterized protein n=1 Tax=Thermococcus chitonophagus TaxID=54262 RepID=A0A160VUP8_9EURY|nr:hypothetical protein [Thermococcus chitonophagus]ASJ16428.1 hypothetical protein A3L04_04720 [Thermococcus chitonophagus]CUX78579.1 hypothetical protein CHITON_1800 [Thermococcus chitonophagus]
MGKNERIIIVTSIFVVLVGLLTALYYGRSDHIYRCSVALFGLSIPLWLPEVYTPKGTLKKLLAPVYDTEVMAFLGVFIAVHVSLVNVPFTTVDLFHKEWRDADMISHFLGGLVLWLMIARILVEFNIPWRDILKYSVVAFYILAIGWEVAEKVSESEISFITETVGNKMRDLIMDSLGMISGIKIRKKITSFRRS